MNKRGQYRFWGNIGYSVSSYWKAYPSLVVYGAAGIVFRVALPFSGILMSGMVIDALTKGVSPGTFVVTIGGLALFMVLLNFVKSFTDVMIDQGIGSMGNIISTQKLSEKLMDMDYENMTKPEAIKLKDKARQAGRNSYTAANNHLRFLVQFLTSALGIVVYGGVIATVHPVLILLLALTSLISWGAMILSRRYESSTRERRATIQRHLGYLSWIIMDRHLSKDMRLYNMSGWLFEMVDGNLKKAEKEQSTVQNRVMYTSWVDGLMTLLRDGGAYIFLIYLMAQGQMELGTFVMMFGAIASFASWISSLLGGAEGLIRSNVEVGDIRAFLSYPDQRNRGEGPDLPPKGKPLDLCLEHVTYTYPGAQKPALTDINLQVKPGERIAIVGANGAGKSTLVKLLCGLYSPTSGSVSVDGVNVASYNRDDYLSLFTVVFQDIHLLSDSIACNVSQQTKEQTDLERVKTCLKLAGFYEKVMSLPQGLKTPLVREVNADAVDLSGGEMQKLALARALYKDAPFILLDEPTAALDPIAENQMYQQYAKLTEGKTSFFISHRLASTQFCDRILFIDDNCIRECGSHEELMKLGGRYAHMFAVQASYYTSQKGGNSDEE